MNIRVRPSDPRPIYVQIVDEIRRALVVGALEPDDPLPSVRELAGELRVNPNTVQQAYRELERDGLAYVRRGRGTFVAERDVDDDERRRLRRQVAERALRDAHRNGLDPGSLVEAIREVSREGADETEEAEETT